MLTCWDPKSHCGSSIKMIAYGGQVDKMDGQNPPCGCQSVSFPSDLNVCSKAPMNKMAMLAEVEPTPRLHNMDLPSTKLI